MRFGCADLQIVLHPSIPMCWNDDDLRLYKSNQQTKINIFAEQLAEVIERAKGGRKKNPSE